MVLYLGKKGNYYLGNNNSINEMCLKLCENYYYKNHIIYMDSYYVSIPLLETLYYKKVYCVGTVRKNRKGLPQYKDIPVGNVEIYFKKFLQFTLWKDKKLISILSTKKNSNIITKIGSNNSE